MQHIDLNWRQVELRRGAYIHHNLYDFVIQASQIENLQLDEEPFGLAYADRFGYRYVRARDEFELLMPSTSKLINVWAQRNDKQFIVEPMNGLYFIPMYSEVFIEHVPITNE